MIPPKLKHSPETSPGRYDSTTNLGKFGGSMNMAAALIGYGSFVLSLLAIGIIGYWKAESLEAWAKAKLEHRHTDHH